MGVSEHVVYPQMTNHPHCIFFAILLCLYTTYSLPIHSILHNLYLYIIHIYIYTLYISISIYIIHIYIYILYIYYRWYCIYIISEWWCFEIFQIRDMSSTGMEWPHLRLEKWPFPMTKKGSHLWMAMDISNWHASKSNRTIHLSLSLYTYIYMWEKL